MYNDNEAGALNRQIYNHGPNIQQPHRRNANDRIFNRGHCNRRSSNHNLSVPLQRSSRKKGKEAFNTRGPPQRGDVQCLSELIYHDRLGPHRA